MKHFIVTAVDNSEKWLSRHNTKTYTKYDLSFFHLYWSHPFLTEVHAFLEKFPLNEELVLGITNTLSFRLISSSLKSSGNDAITPVIRFLGHLTPWIKTNMSYICQKMSCIAHINSREISCLSWEVKFASNSPFKIFLIVNM